MPPAQRWVGPKLAEAESQSAEPGWLSPKPESASTAPVDLGGRCSNRIGAVRYRGYDNEATERCPRHPFPIHQQSS